VKLQRCHSVPPSQKNVFVSHWLLEMSKGVGKPLTVTLLHWFFWYNDLIDKLTLDNTKQAYLFLLTLKSQKIRLSATQMSTCALTTL
jgi:hypothetical protein